MKAAYVILLALACGAVLATATRQDEALDSLLLADVQPVADPVPRLLAEALTPTPGAYGGESLTPDKPIPTTTIPSPPKTATSGSAAAAAGAVSLFAAAAAALAMV